MEAQRCEGAIYVPPLPGAAADYAQVNNYGPALLELMDLPMLRDSDVGWPPMLRLRHRPSPVSRCSTAPAAPGLLLIPIWRCAPAWARRSLRYRRGDGLL